MITAKPNYPVFDRNGHGLSYGDKVLVKYHGIHSIKIGIATIIGFTQKYVCLIWCPGSGNTFCRAPQNVVYVENINKWKANI